MSDTENTRRSRRLPAHHLVSYARTHFGELVEPAPRIGRTLDVSEGGAKLETERSFAQGDRLRLQIAVGDQILEVDATVVHVRPGDSSLFATGVRFDELSADELTALLGVD